MKTLRDMRVGDEIVIVDTYRKTSFPGVVSKVGTKLLYVKAWAQVTAWRLDNGVANDAYGDRRAMTNDQYREWCVTQEAKERLCRFGLVPEARMPDETILRVHDALLSSGVPGYATGPEKPEKEER